MTRRWDRTVAAASAATGIALLLVTLAFVVAGDGFGQRTTLLLLAAVALMAAAGAIDQGLVRALARDRRARQGSLALLAAATALGILAGADVVASRGTQAVDMTRDGLFTLSPRSTAAARKLDSDLVVTAFVPAADQADRRDLQSLLDLYRQQSRHVQVELSDPGPDAARARSLGVPDTGGVALRYRGRPAVVLDTTQPGEADVTGAILRLESDRSPVVCWAGGDGERDLRDSDEATGYTAAADLLRGSRYETRGVLLSQQGVPAACDVLALVQVGRPLDQPASAAVQAYLARGGKLLVALDPWLDPKITAGVNALLQPYGSAFDGGLAIEPDTDHSATGDSTVPLVNEFGASPITSGLDGRYVFLPASTPIVNVPGGQESAIDLASTTAQAYDIAQQRTDLGRRATDKAGPFVLLRSIELSRPEERTRIVMAGTSALAENRTMPPAASGANAELLLASLDWLTEQESLITIVSRPPQPRTSPPSVWDVALALPLPVVVVLVAGLLVRSRRRPA